MRTLTFIVLTVALFCLPALSYLLGTQRVWRGAASGFAAAIGVGAIAAICLPGLVDAPWIGNIVTRYGVLSANEVVIGDQPIILPRAVRYLIGMLVVSISTFTVITVIRLYRTWNPKKPDRDSLSGYDRLAIFWLITLPCCTAYLAVVLVRSYSMLTDRYLLPLVAVALIGILAVADRLPGKHRPVVSWAALLFMGVYAVATTHDAFRLWEARARATDQLSVSGIARACIMGGYEYDGWTELEKTSYIVPPDKVPPRNAPIEYFFLRSTPHVKPKYYVVVSRQSKLAASAVVDIPYSTWLAPRRRRVLVQVDPRASCSDIPDIHAPAR